MPPIKPQVCVIEGKLAVFMGSDYKLLDPAQARTFTRNVQSSYAALLRQEKRKKRAKQ